MFLKIAKDVERKEENIRLSNASEKISLLVSKKIRYIFPRYTNKVDVGF